MEKFECYFVSGKEFFKEYADVLKWLHKRYIIAGISGLLSMLLLIPTAFTTEVYFFIALSWIGFSLLLFVILKGIKTASVRFNNSLTAFQVNYCFLEDSFTVADVNRNSTYKYTAIKRVIESRSLIILQLYSGEELLICKSVMTFSELAGFEQMLMLKTNKPIKKMSSMVYFLPKAVSVIAAFALLFSTTMSTVLLNEAYFSIAENFSIDGYSITASQKFTVADDEAYSVYLKNSLDDTAIKAYCVTFSELEAAGKESDISVFEYAEKYVASKLYEPTEDSVERLDNKHAYVEMEKHINNDVYYCLTVVTKSEQKYWITEFTCLNDEYDYYIEEFLEYAKTIE